MTTMPKNNHHRIEPRVATLEQIARDDRRRWQLLADFIRKSEARWQQTQHEIKRQGDDLKRQGDELKRQGDELKRQGDEMKRQSDRLEILLRTHHHRSEFPPES